jgi:hypothetical protein
MFDIILTLLSVAIIVTAIVLIMKSNSLTISVAPSNNKQVCYTLTNHSRHPIEVSRVKVFVQMDSEYEPIKQPPSFEGIDIPGVLAPKTSYVIKWANAQQVADIAYADNIKLEIYPQNGKVITIIISNHDAKNACLQKSLAETKVLLEKAKCLLPSNPSQGPEGGTLAEYSEYMEYNELVRALNELIDIGRGNNVPADYWLHLAKAAREMGNTDRATEIEMYLKKMQESK